MAASFHTARLALDELVQAVNEAGTLDRNEATTRLQLIDGLVFEVLGWAKDECVSEESHNGTYTDYALGRPFRRLIIEAKREGTTFDLPIGQESGVVPIRTLLNRDALEAALRQALSYAQERGVPFVAVSNGHQLAALVASRQDGVPPLEGRALVFASLEDMRSRFRLLWDNLSREGVAAQQLHQTLRDASVPAPPPKLSERLPGYPRFKIRNRLQTDLQILGDLFLEDVLKSDPAQEEDFLRKCYSRSGALSQYALISREILQTRYSALMSQEAGVAVESASPRDGVAPSLGADVLSAALAKRPIVLLGDVGVGKSIFIRNLIHVEAKEVFGDAITLYVDFVAEPAVATDLRQYVSREIVRQLRETYDVDIEDGRFVTGVYHGELGRFDKSVLGRLKDIEAAAYERERIRYLADKVSNLEGHLRSSLGHIVKGRRKQVIVFLDNVDQRPAEFQEQVYGIAHSMAESWPVAVFVSLRPSTFFMSKKRGSLAAYQPRVFTISPPRVDTVLNRRVRYALDRLEHAGTLDSMPENVGFDWPGGVESLTTYLRTLLHSFSSNRALIELIDNLSGGNVRRALEFVQTFVGSGNVDTEKVLERTERFGSYTIEVHQFLRAIMLGDYQDYVPEASVISNIFDLLTPDGREHFLLPLLLTQIERAGGLGTEEGYVSADAVYDFTQGLGFTPVQVAWALERAVSREMLELRPLTSDGTQAMYRLTSIGSYSVHRLPRMFAYLDAVVSDTPIVDPALRSQIHDARTIDERLARAELFRVYLDKQWSGVAGQSSGYDWKETSDEARSDIWRIGRLVAGWP